MDCPLHVTAFDRSFVRTAWLDDLDRIKVNPRDLALPTAEFDVPTDYRFLEDLTAPGARVTIDLDDEQVLSGPIRPVTGTGPRREGVMTLSVEDDSRILWNLFGYTTPGSPADTQPNKEDARTGSAETVVKGYVSANLGRWGRPIIVAPNLGRGGHIDTGIRMLPLADKLLPLLKQARLGFTVRQVGKGLVFDCYEPQMFPLNLTEDSGVVAAYTFSRTPPAATRAIITTLNAGTSREFKLYVDAAREAEWGDVIEISVDGGDEQNTDKLIAIGKAAVDAAGPKYGYSVTLDETSIFHYGGDGIHVGDEVAIEVDAGLPPLTEVVREAELLWDTTEDNESAGYTARFTVGEEPEDDPDAMTADILDQLARGIRELRTR